jgi:propanol-preferring alcohol dehydrogenase
MRRFAVLGSGVTGHCVGERVGVAWLHRSDGECAFCRSGRENLCLHPQFTGLQVDGGYAEYLTAPADFIYPLPAALTDAAKVAPLLCGGIIGYRALGMAETKPGCRLGLYGFGASAHIAIQIAVYWQCTVYAFSRRERHRQLARELGAAWAGAPTDAPPEPMDSAIIFAPAGELVPLALEHLERGGTCALAGIYMTPTPPLDYLKHLYWEKTLRSVANATREDGHELLKLAAEIPLHTEVETYPLEQANEVLLRLKQGKVQGAAVLIV